MLPSEKLVDALGIAVVAAGFATWTAGPANKDPHRSPPVAHSATAEPVVKPRAQPLRHVTVPALRT